MMRTKLTLVAASLATLMMTSAHAANPTADLSISANVVPSACNMDFANRGTFDYGDIAPSSLSTSADTKLTPKELGYTISCNGPTRVSLKIVDNRIGTVGAEADGTEYTFGVGQANGVNIGGSAYLIKNTNVMVDSNPGSVIVSGDSGTTWWTAVEAGHRVPSDAHKATQRYSFLNAPAGAVVTTSPYAITTAAGNIQSTLAIAPTSTLDLSREINIDGFATVELTYI